MNEGLQDIFEYTPSEVEDYYKILGCDELSSKEQITAEYKARVLHCHPDKHPDDPVKAGEFERIQTAKDILCDDEKRANYDKWRHAGISMSFNKWCNMRGAVHTSMHWMTPKKESMIDDRAHRDRECATHAVTGKHAGHEPQDSSNTYTHSDEYRAMQTDHRANIPWQRDPPSEMLRRFRNYEI